MDERFLQNRIRFWILIFTGGLVISGLTAIGLPAGTEIFQKLAGGGSAWGHSWPAVSGWIELIYRGVHETNEKYPFILYGTDWLAFGHIAIAIAFLGVLHNPVKNIWVIQFGIIACILVIPWALIFGSIRGIPIWWQFIDMSFGLLGLIPLLVAYKHARRLEAIQENR